MESNVPARRYDSHATESPIRASALVSRVPGAAPQSGDRSVCPVRTVAIVGAGMIGVEVAAANVRLRVPVYLSDADPKALATASDRITAELMTQSEASPSETAAMVRRLAVTTTDAAVLGQCGLVLESILESLAAKQELYARLEPHLRPDAILASNTSTIPVARLASKLARPERFLGLHFFHPVLHRPLVEIIRGPKTTEPTVAAAAAYVRAIEKEPLVVGDGPGFVVNRLLQPYLAEALELLLDGVPIGEMESAALRFGMAAGPLHLMDEIGLDTVLLGGRVLWEAFPDRVVASPLLVAMYKSGRLGKKAGSGFFVYDRTQPWRGSEEPAPGVLDLIAAWARPSATAATDDIMARLLLPMVLEATRILEEQKVDGPADIDRAVTLGLGFPSARGGLLRWADSLGPQRLVAMLQRFSHLGPRAQPTPLLHEMARRRSGFYPRAA